MRLIKISMELAIEDNECGSNREDIRDYLNHKLYYDPDFFWRFWSRKYSRS